MMRGVACNLWLMTCLRHSGASCGSDLIEEETVAAGKSIRLLSWITIVAYGEQHSLPLPRLSWRSSVPCLYLYVIFLSTASSIYLLWHLFQRPSSSSNTKSSQTLYNTYILNILLNIRTPSKTPLKYVYFGRNPY
jgi:hypothetical protein